MSDGDGSEEAVRVFVRIRPLNKRELAEKQTIGWNFNETSMLEDTPNGQRVYAFDHCFTPASTNQETYDIIGKPVVLKAMEGYNGTVFTYGQTGSGKTWTMRGSESEPGMMVLCIRDILEWIRSHPDIQYKIRVAYLEVYNEEINDLLGEPGMTSKNLKIVSEDAIRGAVIGGLVEEDASTSEQFMEILRRGEQSRSYASTNMNAESSRSHTIYRITIEAKGGATGLHGTDGDEDDSLMGGAGAGGASSSAGRVSYLNLVDLAGSERQKSTKAEGKVLKEGANINKSLLALGAVIKKLGEVSKVKKGSDKSSSFIPYRDSKLTRILKQSLGGNALTSILCTVTPAPMHREETVSTLKFGQLCKSIKNTVKANDGLMDDKALLKQYKQNIADLKAQLDGMVTGGFGDGHIKVAFESKLKNIEAFMVSKGIPQVEISSVLTAAIATTDEDSGGEHAHGVGQANNEMITMLNEKIAILQSRLNALQEENAELLQMKSSYEEDEQRLQEIHEEMSKVEEERKILQNERFKVLRDSKALDEKEARIGTLLTNLDDKESKLRLKLANMQDQLSQWQRSIADLQKREDLVEEWKKSHEQKEKKLDEMRKQQERKYQELEEREKKITEEENKAKQQHKELAEREQRLQIGLSRVANGEIANTQKEESLQAFEAQLKKKEQECDIRERELSSRRKEMESWDVLLREKDRKILNEQRTLDEREQAISANEEKVKSREVEIERRALEIKQKEAIVTELGNKYEKLLAEVEERERDLKERDREYQSLRKELGNREEELRKWEKQLMKLQEQMKGIEQRERNLKHAEENFRKQESDFYNIKVAQITSRHNQELKKLEDIVAKQLKITGDFQKELDSTRNELHSRVIEVQELEETAQQRQLLIDQLREQLKKYEQGGNTVINGLVSTANDENANNNNHTNNNYHPLASSGSSTSSNASNTNNNNNNNMMTLNELDGTKNNYHHGLNSANTNNNLSHILSEGLTTQQFITQLAITRKLIHQVLEQHDALPDSQTSAVMRRNVPVRLVVAPPPPAGRGAVPIYHNTMNNNSSNINNNRTANANNSTTMTGSEVDGMDATFSPLMIRAPSHHGLIEEISSNNPATAGNSNHNASQSTMPRMGSLQQLFGTIGSTPPSSGSGMNNEEVLLAFQQQQATMVHTATTPTAAPSAVVTNPTVIPTSSQPQDMSNLGNIASRLRKNALSSNVLQPAGSAVSPSMATAGSFHCPPPPPPIASTQAYQQTMSLSAVEEEKDFNLQNHPQVQAPISHAMSLVLAQQGMSSTSNSHVQPPPPPPPPPLSSSSTNANAISSSNHTNNNNSNNASHFRTPIQTTGLSFTNNNNNKSMPSSLASPMSAHRLATMSLSSNNRSVPSPRSFHSSPTNNTNNITTTSNNNSNIGMGVPSSTSALSSKRNAILSPFGSQNKTIASIMTSGDEHAVTVAKVSLDMKSGFKKVVREYEASAGNSVLSSPPASSSGNGRGSLFSPASTSK